MNFLNIRVQNKKDNFAQKYHIPLSTDYKLAEIYSLTLKRLHEYFKYFDILYISNNFKKMSRLKLPLCSSHIWPRLSLTMEIISNKTKEVR